MLDIKAVRQDPENVALALEKRGFSFDIEQFKSLDARRKQADVQSQHLLAERKAASKQIGALVGQGMSVDDAKAPGQVRERPDSPSDTHPNVSRKLACPPNEQPRLNH